MKLLTITLLTMVAATGPVLAQSFEPTAAAVRYCQLRQAGMASRPAMRAAMLEYWDKGRQSAIVRSGGQEFTADQLRFVDLIHGCG